jgi:release factor glutamine methyltransferase
MTNREAYRKAKSILEKAGKDSPAFDTACLCKKFLGLSREQLLISGEAAADPDGVKALLSAAQSRAAGRPLQYLLGEWEFLDLKLKVGEGVLCPREETEELVRVAAERIPQNGHVLDLCAGTGAVGLGLASLRSDLKIICGEKFPQTFSYLLQNTKAYQNYQVEACQMDLFSREDAERVGSLNGLLCNPPYVRSEEIADLQPEVQQEPRTALDGGEDGLLFYRALCKLWVPQVAPNGVVAVEIGEQEGQAVLDLFHESGLESLQLLRDFNELPRVVFGIVPNL